MKKFATLVMGLAAVCALTACGESKGTKVSEEKFKEKAAAIEEHDYSEATVKWNYKESGTTPSYNEETGKLETKEESVDKKGEFKATFSNGSWKTEEKDSYAQQFFSMLSMNLKDVDLKDLTSSASQTAEHYKVEANTSFYTGPLGVAVTAKGDIDGGEEGKGKLDLSTYIAFDQYGFVTKVSYKGTIDVEAKYGEQTIKVSEKMDMSCTISYK